MTTFAADDVPYIRQRLAEIEAEKAARVNMTTIWCDCGPHPGTLLFPSLATELESGITVCSGCGRPRETKA